MGKEYTTSVRIGREERRCTVHLEPRELIVGSAGPLKRRRFPLTELADLQARRGILSFRAGDEPVAIDLGDHADAWLLAITNPKSRTQKLGVKAGHRTCILGPAEDGIADELALAAGTKPARRLGTTHDLVLFFTTEPADLKTLSRIEPALAPRGCVWVLWPKGRKDLRHEEVVAAAKAARLVQTKSIGFSERFSGLRLTRPAS